ncbi:MAG: hypothetical protein WDN10_05305 [bacterium]
MRRILIAGVVLALLAIIGIGLYNFFSASSASPAKSPVCAVTLSERHSMGWKYPGADPLVERKGTHSERLAKARTFDRCSMERAGIPAKVIDAFLKAMAKPGVHKSIKDGVRYDFVSSRGPTVTKNVTTRFGRGVPLKSEKRSATEYVVVVDGVTWIADRFDWCMNLGVRHVRKPKKHHPPKRHQPPPPVKVTEERCYRMPYDYRTTTGENGKPLPAIDVSDGFVHHQIYVKDLTSEVMAELISDPCTYMHDETGDYRLELGCDCARGGYPSPEVAERNDLPAQRPEAVAHVKGRGLVGYYSYPIDFNRSTLYCVRTNGYHLETRGFEAFMAFSRFEIVSRTAVAETRQAGQLSWAVTGSGKTL